MSQRENYSCHWKLLCFLGLLNKYMFVWAKEFPNIEHSSVKQTFIARNWSDWTPWSVCSRTCGGGVRMRTRMCRIRMVGYTSYTSNCSGETVEYELCSRQSCPPYGEDFLDYQCSQRNGQLAGTRKIEDWIPYRYGMNPCELQCWPKDRSLVFSFGKVIDGTKCPVPEAPDSALCVNGRCTPVDCAGLLGSDNRRDQCGVCRGDNSTCLKYQNTFWRRPRNEVNHNDIKDYHYDYEEVTNIPPGATNILVTENSDTNFLVLADHKRNYHINGNWRVQSPGRFRIHGSEFVYNRTWDGHESLSSSGPTRLNFFIFVLGTGDIPTVRYEYWISSNLISEADLPQALNQIKVQDHFEKRIRDRQEPDPFNDVVRPEPHSKKIKTSPATKFRGYDSYYHRNEILKSVPSWSMKRQRSFKNPTSYASDSGGVLNSGSSDRGVSHGDKPHRSVSLQRNIEYKQTYHVKRNSSVPGTSVLRNRGRENQSSGQFSYLNVKASSTSVKEKKAEIPLPDSNRSKQEGGIRRRKSPGKRNLRVNGTERFRIKKKRKSGISECSPCEKSRHQTKSFCKSEFVLRAIVRASEKQQHSTRYELEVIQSYKNKVPILSREYVWTADICQCPKLRTHKEYILMGYSSTVDGKRESQLMVDKNSFVRQYNRKRARTMMRLVRDQKSTCSQF